MAWGSVIDWGRWLVAWEKLHRARMIRTRRHGGWWGQQAVQAKATWFALGLSGHDSVSVRVSPKPMNWTRNANGRSRIHQFDGIPAPCQACRSPQLENQTIPFVCKSSTRAQGSSCFARRLNSDPYGGVQVRINDETRGHVTNRPHITRVHHRHIWYYHSLGADDREIST